VARSDWSKAREKAFVERVVGQHLSRQFVFTNREKMFLRDAIGHAFKGLFGLATQDLRDMRLPESAWSPAARVTAAMVANIDHSSLATALAVLKASPVQERPIFS